MEIKNCLIQPTKKFQLYKIDVDVVHLTFLFEYMLENNEWM